MSGHVDVCYEQWKDRKQQARPTVGISNHTVRCTSLACGRKLPSLQGQAVAPQRLHVRPYTTILPGAMQWQFCQEQTVLQAGSFWLGSPLHTHPQLLAYTSDWHTTSAQRSCHSRLLKACSTCGVLIAGLLCMYVHTAQPSAGEGRLESGAPGASCGLLRILFAPALTILN